MLTQSFALEKLHRQQVVTLFFSISQHCRHTLCYLDLLRNGFLFSFFPLTLSLLRVVD